MGGKLKKNQQQSIIKMSQRIYVTIKLVFKFTVPSTLTNHLFSYGWDQSLDVNLLKQVTIDK